MARKKKLITTFVQAYASKHNPEKEIILAEALTRMLLLPEVPRGTNENNKYRQ